MTSSSLLQSQSCQSLADWLCYIEQSHPIEKIELGLGRVSQVASRGELQHLPGRVILIAGTNGWPIGEVGSAEAEEILYADVDLSSARSAPIWNTLNDLPRDRRTDLYDASLGYRLHAPMPR